VIKSRRIRWAGHVAITGEMRGAYRLLMGETWGERGKLKDLSVEGRIILKLFFKK
jgi:hypothetical protein